MGEEFYRIAAEVFPHKKTDLNRSALLKKDLKADSLVFLTLVLALEAEYSCSLDDGALALVVTLGDLEDLVLNSTGKVVAEVEREPRELL